MSLPSEEAWRPVPGYEGYYEVSDQGRVRSLDRTVTNSLGHSQRRRGQILKPIPHYANRSTGRRCIFLAVNLKRDGHSRTETVHKLVMAAFVGPRPDGYEVCHRNGNAQDCRLVNMYYGTASDNTLDRIRHGVHNQARKTHCPRGHLLVEPNLVRGSAARGHRACLACNRATAYVRAAKRYGRSYDVTALSHDYYARIMASQPTSQTGDCP